MPRISCLDCVRKHLAQAEVLMQEARLGYPDHYWLSMGHLAEAESEALTDYKHLAMIIREERVKYVESSAYNIDTLRLIGIATELAGANAAVTSSRKSTTGRAGPRRAKRSKA